MLRYAAKFAADWACLELLTHCLYFNSIAKYRIGLRYRQHGLQFGTLEMGAWARTAQWVGAIAVLGMMANICVASACTRASAAHHPALRSYDGVLGPVLHVAQVCHHLAVHAVSSRKYWTSWTSGPLQAAV